MSTLVMEKKVPELRQHQALLRELLHGYPNNILFTILSTAEHASHYSRLPHKCGSFTSVPLEIFTA